MYIRNISQKICFSSEKKNTLYFPPIHMFKFIHRIHRALDVMTYYLHSVLNIYHALPLEID